MRKAYAISILFLVVAIGMGFYIHENSQTVNITIETNGTDIIVKSSTLFFAPTPPGMEEEIADHISNSIYAPESTLDSIKADVKLIASKYGYKKVNVQLRSQFGVDQLPMPAVVKGNSMYPTLRDGQRIIVLKTKDFKVGDIVVAKHPEYGLIVKRVGKIEGDRVYLISDNKNIEQIYTGTSIVTLVPLNTWLPRSAIIGVVKEIM